MISCIAEKFLEWVGNNYEEETLLEDTWIFLKELRKGSDFHTPPTAEEIALQEKSANFDLNDWDELIDRVHEIRGRGQDV